MLNGLWAENMLTTVSGYVQAYAKLNAQEREDLSKKHAFPGLGQGKETTEWLWNSQFAAVVADAPAFEASRKSYLSLVLSASLTRLVVAAADPKYQLHPILLAGWGTPIGELFDLEALSETCKTLGRWTFFLSSAPLNYTGVVASPPNVLAFF